MVVSWPRTRKGEEEREKEKEKEEEKENDHRMSERQTHSLHPPPSSTNQPIAQTQRGPLHNREKEDRSRREQLLGGTRKRLQTIESTPTVHLSFPLLNRALLHGQGQQTDRALEPSEVKVKVKSEKEM